MNTKKDFNIEMDIDKIRAFNANFDENIALNRINYNVEPEQTNTVETVLQNNCENNKIPAISDILYNYIKSVDPYHNPYQQNNRGNNKIPEISGNACNFIKSLDSYQKLYQQRNKKVSTDESETN